MSASLVSHFQMLGRYNSIANERLYDVCATLSSEEFRREGYGSFQSIHRSLNHILLGDRIWMARFTTDEIVTTPALGTVLYEDFEALREARILEDALIETFLSGLTEQYLRGSVHYINSAGKHYTDTVTLVLQHMFNHATHHRGQIHVMLSQFGKTLNLDMHRAIHPEWMEEQASA